MATPDEITQAVATIAATDPVVLAAAIARSERDDPQTGTRLYAALGYLGTDDSDLRFGKKLMARYRRGGSQ